MSGRRQRANKKLAQVKETILAEAADLVEPAAVWVRGQAEHFPFLPNTPAEPFSAVEAILGIVCTIGERLETKSRNYFAGREYTRG